MHFSYRTHFAVLLAASLLALSLGCKDKAQPVAGPDAQTVEAAQKLPEGTNVLAALDQKDYESAVAALAKVQQSLETDDQKSSYSLLRRYTADKITEASLTDPKASEALNAIRMLIQGR